MGRRPRDAEGNRGGSLSMAKGSGRQRPGTRLVTAGRRAEWTGAAVNPPVWRTSTHLYEDSADLAAGRPNADGHFYYGRRGTPTQWALAEALTEIEPGDPETVIGHAIQNKGIDLLIMGAYTHSPLRKLFTGSKTTELLRAPRVPTLLLR